MPGYQRSLLASHRWKPPYSALSGPFPKKIMQDDEEIPKENCSGR